MRFDRWIVLAVFLLSGCATSPDIDKPVLLSAEQVRSLFSGNTVRSYNLSNKLTTWSFYQQDGTLYQERLWERRQGTWSIKSNGVICLEVTHLTCKLIGRVGDRFYKYKVDAAGELDAIIAYRDFAVGDPFGLSSP